MPTFSLRYSPQFITGLSLSPDGSLFLVRAAYPPQFCIYNPLTAASSYVRNCPLPITSAIALNNGFSNFILILANRHLHFYDSSGCVSKLKLKREIRSFNRIPGTAFLFFCLSDRTHLVVDAFSRRVAATEQPAPAETTCQSCFGLRGARGEFLVLYQEGDAVRLGTLNAGGPRRATREVFSFPERVVQLEVVAGERQRQRIVLLTHSGELYVLKVNLDESVEGEAVECVGPAPVGEKIKQFVVHESSESMVLVGGEKRRFLGAVSVERVGEGCEMRKVEEEGEIEWVTAVERSGVVMYGKKQSAEVKVEWFERMGMVTSWSKYYF